MYGFARANITPDKLAPLLLGDPFSRYYTTLYLNTVKTNKKALETYNNDTRGQEVNDLSEYSRMTEFFQPLLEPLIGVNTLHYSVSTSVGIVIAIAIVAVATIGIAFIVNFVIVFVIAIDIVSQTLRIRTIEISKFIRTINHSQLTRDNTDSMKICFFVNFVLF